MHSLKYLIAEDHSESRRESSSRKQWLASVCDSRKVQCVGVDISATHEFAFAFPVCWKDEALNPWHLDLLHSVLETSETSRRPLEVFLMF